MEFKNKVLPLRMVNNIFKALYLIVAICLVIVLYDLSKSIKHNNRYKVFVGKNHLTVYDLETNNYYLWIGGELRDRNLKRIKSIPK